MTDATPVKNPGESGTPEVAASPEEEILLDATMIAEPATPESATPESESAASELAAPESESASPTVESAAPEPAASEPATAESESRSAGEAFSAADVVAEGAFSLWSPDGTQAQGADTAVASASAVDAEGVSEGTPHFVSPEDEDRIDVPVLHAGAAGDSGRGGDGQPPALGTPAASEPEDEKPMTLLEHLGELRSRLTRVFIVVTICFLGCYSFAKELFYYLSLPLLKVMTADAKFIYTGVAEGFFVELKVAFVAGIFVASPYLFYQIWAFIAPGLYDEEKRYVTPLALCSALFFLGGAAFCYLVVFPFAFVFFMSYSTDNIVAMLSINEYLSFALKMMLAFGFIFEMPLFAFFLARMGLVTADRMRSARKYAILAIFIVAAILTPPDVFSQLLMALPMLVLYEVSIFVAKVARRPQKKTPPASADPAADPEAESEQGQPAAGKDAGEKA